MAAYAVLRRGQQGRLNHLTLLKIRVPVDYLARCGFAARCEAGLSPAGGDKEARGLSPRFGLCPYLLRLQ